MKKQSNWSILAILFLLLTGLSSNSISQQCNADFSYSIIVDDSLQFTDLSTCSGGYCIMQWDWDFDDGQTSSLRNPTHQYSTTGIYNVNLTIRIDSMGYTHNCNVTIPVNTSSKPTAIFSSTTPGCSGGEIFFDESSITPIGNISEWHWDFGDGTNLTVVYPDDPDVNHIYSSPDDYIATLIVINSSNYSDTTQNSVSVTPNPIADFTYNIVCAEDPVLFTDMSSSNGGGDIEFWLWNFGDPVSGINDTSSLQNPSHTFTEPGNYNVELIVTNISGCVDTIISNIEIAEPGLEFSWVGDCFGSTTYFEVDETITNIAEVQSWNWSFGDGGTSSQQNPSHLYTIASGYYVTLSIVTINGCITEITHNLIINALPDVEISADTYTADINMPIQFYGNSSSGGIASWNWNFGDGNFSTTQNPVHEFINYGTYEITLDVEDIYGCMNSDTNQIQIITPPIFPDTGAIWNTLGYSYGTPAYRYRYGIIGDTLINIPSKDTTYSYSKIYNLYDSTLSTNNSTYFGAIRNTDDGKVYVKLPYLPETILYDYTLEIGDTIWFNVGGAAASGTVEFWEQNHYKVVTDIDSTLLLDNQYHTQWFLQGEIMDVTWVEGIGSVTWFGLFNPIISDIATNGDSFSLACFKENDIPLYINNPECDNCFCYLLTNLDKIQVSNKSNIDIYPNPAKNIITISSTESVNKFAEINIYNSFGTKVYSSEKHIDTEIKVDVSNWIVGVYIVTIQNNKGKLNTGRFIIE